MEPLSDLTTSLHLPLRILVVDDAPQVRRDLRLLLELHERLQVVGEAANGAEAIVQVENMHPDVVLMDLVMPVMDGYQATRLIKARVPTCRVIAFSVHSYSHAREEARKAGADDFIEKGAPLDEIVLKIAGGTES